MAATLIVPVSTPVEFVGLRSALPGRHVVCWYGWLKNNSREASQPLVVVSFRECDDQGQFGTIRSAPIALTGLGQLRLGSVVEDGWCRARLTLSRERFDVDFSTAGWKLEHARACLGSLSVPSERTHAIWWCGSHGI